MTIPVEGFTPLTDALRRHGDFLKGCTASPSLKPTIVGGLSLVLFVIRSFTLESCTEIILLAMRDVVRDALSLSIKVEFVLAHIRGLASNLFRYRGLAAEIASIDSKEKTVERRVARLRGQLLESEHLLAETRMVHQALVKEQEGVPLPNDHLGPIPLDIPLS